MRMQKERLQLNSLGLNFDGGYYMLFEEHDSKLKISDSRHITKKAFINKFGERHDYETLISHENTDDKWKDIFDWLKQKGILN